MMKDMGHVLTFLKSKDPNELSKLMIDNNSKKNSYHGYTIIFADGFWYAWFEVDINDILSEKIKDVRISKGQRIKQI